VTRARPTRGASLVEVLLSMGVALAGMLALSRVLVTSITGSATAARLGQAQLRAATLVELVRLGSRDTVRCLATTPSARWPACGASFAVESPDRSGQIYVLDPSSGVRVAGAHGGAFEVRIVVGFNDDNAITTAPRSRYHTVTLRTGVYP
jgi:hypothetical protein